MEQERINKKKKRTEYYILIQFDEQGKIQNVEKRKYLIFLFTSVKLDCKFHLSF